MDFEDAAYSQPLRLTYSLHSKTMMESIQSCQRRLCYTDVQIISEGGILFAHSIVLAGASNFLKQLLITNPDPTIVIHLPGVEYEPLRLLLEVLYGGEELQLNLKQVVALQDLGSLLHIDMCNSAAMEQAFLQASQEGVLSIPGSLQQSVDVIPHSNESSPSPTPHPPQQTEMPRRTPARSSNSPGKSSHNNNNNNNNPSSVKKRKSGVQNSPVPMAPFSLLANVTSVRTAPSSKRKLIEDPTTDLGLEDEQDTEKPIPHSPPKKLSRAAMKEMVTCRECHTPFKLIMQLNQHMTREGHLFPPCPECGTVHSTLESLITHVDFHPPETVFTCKYCQKGVLGHDRYLYHMLMCKSLIRGDYVCFICRKSFRNSGSLKTHLLLHTGAKPFPCNYCSASFRQRHHRSHHERSVHLMQGLANTDQIETASADTELPTTSQSVVDSSRPFPCGFCNAAFRQSNHRSYHERVIHGVDRRNRQPKGGSMIRIPTNVGSGDGNRVSKGSNGGARKSLTRPGVGNGFTSAADAEDDEDNEIEDPDDGEAEDLEPDPNAEDGDLVEEIDGEVEGDVDGWIDEELDHGSPEQEVEDEEQLEEEEDEEEEDAESEAAPEAGSPISANTKNDSEPDDAD